MSDKSQNGGARKFKGSYDRSEALMMESPMKKRRISEDDAPPL